MDLAQLHEVFPEADSEVLRVSLDKCNGDIQATVEMLLTSASLVSTSTDCKAPAQPSKVQTLHESAEVTTDGKCSTEGQCSMVSKAFEKSTVTSTGNHIVQSLSKMASPQQCEARRMHHPEPMTSPPRDVGKDHTDHGVAGKPGYAGLVSADNVQFPLAKIPSPLCSKADGAVEFSWCSLKTKTSLQGGAFGPDTGSTWLWFLVAEVMATRRMIGSENFTDVRVLGNKFQAGWVPDPSKSVTASLLRTRHHSMLQSAMDGTLNEYGSGRGGTPEGFSHAWNYSDSSWVEGDTSYAVSKARWKEVKGKDRWRIDISMLWHGPEKMREGRHFLVAEQRAEKLNPNQYATAMRGAIVPIVSDTDGKEALLGMVKLYEGDHGKAKVHGEQSGLLRWAKKRPSLQDVLPGEPLPKR